MPYVVSRMQKQTTQLRIYASGSEILGRMMSITKKSGITLVRNQRMKKCLIFEVAMRTVVFVSPQHKRIVVNAALSQVKLWFLPEMKLPHLISRLSKH